MNIVSAQQEHSTDIASFWVRCNKKSAHHIYAATPFEEQKADILIFEGKRIKSRRTKGIGHGGQGIGDRAWLSTFRPSQWPGKNLSYRFSVYLPPAGSFLKKAPHKRFGYRYIFSKCEGPKALSIRKHGFQGLSPWPPEAFSLVS